MSEPEYDVVELVDDQVIGVDLNGDPVFASTPVVMGPRGPKGEDGSGSGGGAVSSVNGRTGAVTGLAEASQIPDVSGFITAAALDPYATIDELDQVRDGIPDITPLATKAELATVADSVPSIAGLATDARVDAVQASIPSIAGLATEDQVNAVAAAIPSIAGLATSAEVAAASTADRARANHTGTQTASTISDFDAAADARIAAVKGQPSGLATLTAGGKLAPSQVPAIAVTETFPVASQAAMLALSAAEQGDVAVRSDISKSFILRADPYSTLSNWTELLTPASPVNSVNGRVGSVTGLAEQSDLVSLSNATYAHVTDNANPHSVTAAQVGLGNVNNTSDASKPISSATQIALNFKQDFISTGSNTQVWRGDKTWVTLTQDIVPDGTTNKAYTGAEKTKLAGIAAAATANSTDASLRDRSTHTGTQAQSTVVNLVTDLAAKQAASVIAASGKGYVNHGATAGTTRPSGYASIEWRGSVQPTNMTTADTWISG